MEIRAGYFASKVAMIISKLRINGKLTTLERASEGCLRLNDAPGAVQAFAMRKELFYGDGGQERPFVGGWLVPARVVSRNRHALTWLVEKGFRRYGEYWGRPDDFSPKASCANLVLG